MSTKYFIYPFANTGDKTAVPNATQTDGSVSYQTGYGFDYQRDLLTDPDAKAFPRQQNNQTMYDITKNIQQYQQHGVPNFISTSDNGGVAFPYDIYAYVLYLGEVYQSIVSTNTSLPTDTTKWRKEPLVQLGYNFNVALTSPPQSIPNNVFTKIVWNVVNFDRQSCFNLATSRYTCKEAGDYFFTATATTTASNTINTLRAVDIYRNGSSFIRGQSKTTGASASEAPSATASCVVPLLVNDYVEVYMYQTDTTALNSSNDQLMQFSGYKLPTPS